MWESSCSRRRKAFSFGHPCIDYLIEKTLLMRDAVMTIMMMLRRRRRSSRRRVTTAAALEAAEGRGRIVTGLRSRRCSRCRF
jgi:hypothetical protein